MVKINMRGSYKLGMDEVEGLEQAMREALAPVQAYLKDLVYWEHNVAMHPVEYKSRDGFIANKDNCGGLAIDLILPECESSSFLTVEFGEYEPSSPDLTEDEQDSERESEMSDGLLDARLRIWLKFEGLNDTGGMDFYLTADAGNGDAPYFRVQHLSELFSASFSTKSVKGLKRAASKHVKALIRALEG